MVRSLENEMISLNIHSIRGIRNTRRLLKVRQRTNGRIGNHDRACAVRSDPYPEQVQYISVFYSIETISARIRAHSPVDDETHTLIPIFQQLIAINFRNGKPLASASSLSALYSKVFANKYDLKIYSSIFVSLLILNWFIRLAFHFDCFICWHWCCWSGELYRISEPSWENGEETEQKKNVVKHLVSPLSL